MNQHELENLSALVDGELGNDALRFLLRRADANVEFRAAWSRYHMIGAGLRREVPVLADANFADRVMAALAAESTLRDQPVQPAAHRYRWLRWSGGGVIAAGVAVAALTLLSPQSQPGSANPLAQPQIATVHATTAEAAVPQHSTAVPRWLSAAPVAAQLAQPAAANFAPGWSHQLSAPPGYGSQLAPYMHLPDYRDPKTHAARQAMYRIWLVLPPVAERGPGSVTALAH